MFSNIEPLLAIGLYVIIIFFIGFISHKKHLTASDFIIGSRSLNFWLTALSAHASDMSSWLFMGLPAVIFSKGLFRVWEAVGLCLFMLLNWMAIAPRLRDRTEKYNALTISSFFANRFDDKSGGIGICTAILSVIFYTVYVSAGIVALGILTESLFGINYQIATTCGLLILMPYLLIGGYLTIAWVDLFQGFFLLFAIIIVPIIAYTHIDSEWFLSTLKNHGFFSTSIAPRSMGEARQVLYLIAGWGLGYFGQPHILTKFMGIKKTSDLMKSTIIGMTWQTIALGGAILVGILGIVTVAHCTNPEMVFINMTKTYFHPFLSALILCAILGATISTIDSQILVLSSTLTEDFYKKFINTAPSQNLLLKTSRFFTILVLIIAYLIALPKLTSIYALVLYAWSGLGSSFGPLLLFSLYSKKANKLGAYAGIIVGGIVAILWPLVFNGTPLNIPPIIPGFTLGSLAIQLGSLGTNRRIPLKNGSI